MHGYDRWQGKQGNIKKEEVVEATENPKCGKEPDIDWITAVLMLKYGEDVIDFMYIINVTQIGRKKNAWRLGYSCPSLQRKRINVIITDELVC